MNPYSVRRRTLLAAGLASTALVAACEDKRVKELKTGITRDSAISVIAQDRKPGLAIDSVPNVYTQERFIIGGKTYNILYFTPDNDKSPIPVTGNEALKIRDTIPYKRLTPLVFVDNMLAGRGWPYWDSVSNANKIPLKKR